MAATGYSETIDALLRPVETRSPLVLDLFAGCGGLALGFEASGFETHGFEQDAACCETYRANLRGECTQLTLTPETDFPRAQVIIGGPPCQPFSVGGKQKGLKDSRDGFPAFVSAVKKVQPDIWLFENVRGLMYRNKWYLEQIIEALEDLGYIVEAQLLNAINYGVPQNRERMVVVGHKGGFSFPAPSNHRVTAGEALGDLASQIPENSRFLTPSMDAYIKKYEIASQCVRPRDLHLDKPARTLTCRNLAGATGDMQRILLPDGRRRRLLAREAARLQSFPDWFEFQGTETQVFNQIGNAVAPLFALHLAKAVRDYLEADDRVSIENIRAVKREKQLALF